MQLVSWRVSVLLVILLLIVLAFAMERLFDHPQALDRGLLLGPPVCMVGLVLGYQAVQAAGRANGVSLRFEPVGFSRYWQGGFVTAGDVLKGSYVESGPSLFADRIEDAALAPLRRGITLVMGEEVPPAVTPGEPAPLQILELPITPHTRRELELIEYFGTGCSRET
jgi:hypothetical protein